MNAGIVFPVVRGSTRRVVSSLALATRAWCAALATAAAFTQSAHGATCTWSGANGNNWTDPENWVGGAFPGATNGTANPDVAIFTNAFLNPSPAFDVPKINLCGFIFEGDGAGMFTLGTTDGSAVLLSSGGAVTLNPALTDAQTVNAPLIIQNAAAATSGAYTIGNNSTSVNAWLTLGGDITGMAAAGNTTTVTFGGIRPLNAKVDIMSGGISDGSAGGKLGLTIGSGWEYLQNGPAMAVGMVPGGCAANWQFSASNTFTGPVTVNAGATPSSFVPNNPIRLSGLDGRFSGASALAIKGNALFAAGDIFPENNAAVTNRINPNAPLTLGDASGRGTFILASAYTTHYQSFTNLTVGAGQNNIRGSGTYGGVNTLNFSGSSGSVYVRNAHGMVDFNTNINGTITYDSGLTVTFDNAPTNSVSGTAGNEILIGATLSGSDFVSAASGTVAAPTDTANDASSLTADANMSITSMGTTQANNTTLSINSLRFPDTPRRILNLGTGSTLTNASGGILLPMSVTASALNHPITNGTITSGQGDLWIYAGSGDNLVTGRGGNKNGDPRGANYAMTIASVIADNGASPVSLTVGGGSFSQIRLSGVNSYSGGTYLQNGLIGLSADSALGATSGKVTVVSGLNFFRPTATFTFNSSRDFAINGGASLEIGDAAGVNTTIAGQVSGGGDLQIGNTGGNRVILTGNNSGFTGRYFVNSYLQATEGMGLSTNANLWLAGKSSTLTGILETSGTFSRALGSGAGQVLWKTIGGGFSAVGGPLAVNIGGHVTPDTLIWGSTYFGLTLSLQSPVATHDVTFQNSVNLNGGARTINVFASETNKAILSGVLSDTVGGSKLTKAGSGTLILSGVNTYTGLTDVTAGTLGGTCTLAGPLNVATAGKVSPGPSISTIGTFTVNNSVTLLGSTFMKLNRSNAQQLAILGSAATRRGPLT